MITKDRYEQLADSLEEAINSHVEYCEGHEDAGDGYSHLPREGCWTYGNGDERLADYIEEHEIETNGLDIDTIADLVLDNFEMQSGHTLGHHGNQSDFVIDSFPIGEIEDQYCFDDYERLGFKDEDEMRAFAGIAKDDNRFCLHISDYCILAYTGTDAVWYAIIGMDALQELIKDAGE
mgnify:CR=1 FL=1